MQGSSSAGFSLETEVAKKILTRQWKLTFAKVEESEHVTTKGNLGAIVLRECYDVMISRGINCDVIL